MKNLIVLTIITLFTGCVNNVNEESSEKLTTYYIEVKYVDNTKDTLIEDYSYYPSFNLQTQENSRGACLCSGWNRLACDVKTFKIIKEKIK